MAINQISWLSNKSYDTIGNGIQCRPRKTILVQTVIRKVMQTKIDLGMPGKKNSPICLDETLNLMSCVHIMQYFAEGRI